MIFIKSKSILLSPIWKRLGFMNRSIRKILSCIPTGGKSLRLETCYYEVLFSSFKESVTPVKEEVQISPPLPWGHSHKACGQVGTESTGIKSFPCASSIKTKDWGLWEQANPLLNKSCPQVSHSVTCQVGRACTRYTNMALTASKEHDHSSTQSVTWQPELSLHQKMETSCGLHQFCMPLSIAWETVI